MSLRKRNNKKSSLEERRLTIRGIRRDPPDVSKLGRALISLVMAEAEREAQAEQNTRSETPGVTPKAKQQEEDGALDA